MSHLPPVLTGASIDDAVLALRPDYRALLVVVTGVRAGPTDSASDAALRRAEERTRARLAGAPPESLPQIVAWRDAFLGFGVKPRAARSSVEALVRRVDAGLPRIDRLTDLYNAVSVEHLIPVGGEDLDAYTGPAWSEPPATNRSTPSPTASRPPSPPTPARSCGATTSASPAGAGTGANACAPA